MTRVRYLLHLVCLLKIKSMCKSLGRIDIINLPKVYFGIALRTSTLDSSFCIIF